METGQLENGPLATWLRRSDKSVTRKRWLVVQALKPDRRRTATELAKTLQGRVGLTTIYRTLQLLEGLKLVKRGADGAYELTDTLSSHRDYRICRQCGRRTAFRSEQLERAIAKLDHRTTFGGFQIDHHTLELTGRCYDCRTDRTAAR